MNVLITGKNGQLGSELQEVSMNSPHTFVFCDSIECDICDAKAIESIVSKHNIQTIINCAAYTAVDKAEDDEKNAMYVNFIGVQNLNTIAEKFKIKLIHISTDYVFSGGQKKPYEPEDAVSPVGVYGKSKRKGEEVILNSNADAIVLRTSWLYSSFGNNFVKTMLRLGKKQASLNVVDDQFGSPTYARDLAQFCIRLLDVETLSSKRRIYHYANAGEISWCTFAQEIMSLARLNCKIDPISSDKYPTKAERPDYSVLSTVAIESDFNASVSEWKNALKECMNRLL
ncbi:dTDP-4-dehydrorhamnose reductase [Crocinitomicaceae bacterium]|nr:dTDP-4-dehydrorhamnose reductase [Crocinitomicaceae bacterium]